MTGWLLELAATVVAVVAAGAVIMAVVSGVILAGRLRRRLSTRRPQ